MLSVKKKHALGATSKLAKDSEVRLSDEIKEGGIETLEKLTL